MRLPCSNEGRWAVRWILSASSLAFGQLSGAMAAATQGDADPGPDAFALPDLDSWLELGGEVVFEWSGVASGGVRRRDDWRNLTLLEATADLAELTGTPGAGTLFLQGQSIRAEGGGSLDSGDFQVYSNLESDETRDDLMEAWYERRVQMGRGRVKVGKVEANAEYALVECAGDFTHSSAGFSPSIPFFPSYPDPAPSINLFVDVGAPWEGATSTLGIGVFDGSFAQGRRTGRLGFERVLSGGLSDASFQVLQWEVRTDHGGDDASRLSLGAWRHTATFERFRGGTESDTAGLFLTAERSFHGLAPGGPLHLFMQYGWSDDEVSEVGQHFGLGGVLEGFMPGRAGDSLGLYASLADLSDAPGSPFARDELALDLYYRAPLGERFFVQPEVQWIASPGGDPALSDALILGLRVGASF